MATLCQLLSVICSDYKLTNESINVVGGSIYKDFIKFKDYMILDVLIEPEAKANV